MPEPLAYILVGALIFAVGVLTGVYLVYWGPRYWWYKEHGVTRQKTEKKPKSEAIGFRS